MYGVYSRFQQYFTATSERIYAFLEFFKPVLLTVFFPSHWLFSQITFVETADNSEREMNPVAMTIIKPWKEYWPSSVLNFEEI